MKYLILMCLFLSFNSFAWSSKEILLNCESGGKDFTKKSRCDSFYSDCVKIPKKFNCETFAETDELTNDLDNPNWGARSMIGPCAGEQDCIDKALALECAEGRHSLYNVEYSEIWCNKIVSYPKKPTGKKLIKEDATKKSIYLAAKLVEKENAELEHSKIMALKTKLKSGDLTLAEMSKALKYLLRKLK